MPTWTHETRVSAVSLKCTMLLHTITRICVRARPLINETRDTCTYYTHAHVYSLLCATILCKRVRTCTQVRSVTHRHMLMLHASTNMQPLFIQTSTFAHSHHMHLASRWLTKTSNEQYVNIQWIVPQRTIHARTFL